jgi:hypothetical protein
MPPIRRTLLAGTTVLLLAGLSACGGDEDSPAADPATTRTTSPSPVEPASAGPTGWEKRYSHVELVAYENALSRWQEYSEALARIYKRGKNTPAARATIREYDLAWQGEVAILDRYYDKGGVRDIRGPEALWSRPRDIIMNRDGTGTVLIEQCTDYRRVLVVRRDGKPAKVKPKHPITPVVINMAMGKGDDWKVADLRLRDKRSCAA